MLLAQRRIWVGRPERSALVRKLKRDYYDWRRPPRFFEEAVPERYEIRPWYERLWLNLRLWLGTAQEELRSWPPRIPEKDRAMLRYWVAHSLQTRGPGTAITVLVQTPQGQPLGGAIVELVGNYTSAQRQQVQDIIRLKTGPDGRATLESEPYSVLSTLWYARAMKGKHQSPYQVLQVLEGKKTFLKLLLRE